MAQTIEDFQASQQSFFNLLIGFMALGLVVGIAALGVISARAVVERRHEIGVVRSIGFSRRMVQSSFLAESSFIALMGIGLGLILGLLMSINIIADIRTDEPNIEYVVPWGTVIVLGLAHTCSLWLLPICRPVRQPASHPLKRCATSRPGSGIVSYPRATRRKSTRPGWWATAGQVVRADDLPDPLLPKA